MRRAAALSFAVWALATFALAACVGPRRAAPPPGAGPDFGRAFMAKVGEAFVDDPAHNLVWLGVVSHELPFDRAEVYCRQLPPHGPGAWRVPDVGELAAAPFDRYHLPDPPVRLWSATPIPGDSFRRFAIDPYTGAPEPREVRQGVHLRVLCVTTAGPR